MHDSGASRREIAKLWLECFCCFEDFEVGGAKRSLTSPMKRARHARTLIRASINLRHKFFRRWITGSSPVTTISIGMKVIAIAMTVSKPVARGLFEN
jgi:hypothetical protein